MMSATTIGLAGADRAPQAWRAATARVGLSAAVAALSIAASGAASAQSLASASSPAVAFTCEARAAAVTPPKPSPPALQSLQTAAQERTQPPQLAPACPDGKVPVPAIRDNRYFHKGNPRLGAYVAPGPAHALPAEFVNEHLLLSFDQVYGKTAAPARPAPAIAPPAPACDGIAYYDSCYYYGNAAEQITSDGGGMTFDIEWPLNFEGTDGGHSIDEIAVEAAGSSLTDVEMGWSVSADQWGDINPHLFIYHWIDNAETCYDACGWNQYSATYYPGMSLSSLVGKPIYMGWVHADGAWWAWFNDQWMGYFDDSIWSGTFTKAGLIQWYGEIASSNGVPPRSQMGNGSFPQSDSAASMATMCAADASTWFCSYDDQQSTGATLATYYDVVNHSSYGAARYGGPGQTGTVTPGVTVTPSSTSTESSEPLDVTISANYGTGNPAPTGSVKLSSGTYSSAETTLSSGTAQITIPAGALKGGTETLTGEYTPDARSAPTFGSASGKATVMVTSTAVTPRVKVSPSSTSITTTKPLGVKVIVVTVSGKSTPTGTVKLTSGSYASSLIALSGGDASILIPARRLAAGTDKLTVTYSPSTASAIAYNNAAGSSTVTVTKTTQTIDFTAPPSTVTYGVAPIPLKATASSKLQVTFSVVSGPARVSGVKVTITGAGTVVVSARQAGNAIYAAAKVVERTITVNKAKLTVTATGATTYTITGFVNDDTQEKATTGRPEISVSGNMIRITAGTLAAKNYTFTFIDGKLP